MQSAPPSLTMAPERSASAPPVIGRPLLRRDVVTSTMDELLVHARAGAGEGTTLLAEYQSAGRGRAGRGWLAPPGTSLLLSVLLRPRLAPSDLTPLSLLAAACVAEAIATTTGLQARIKWPNDVLIDDRKVSGILATVSMMPEGDPAVILGLGINVNVASTDLPAGATSLLNECGAPLNRERLLAELLKALGQMYRAFQIRDYGAWWQRATARLAYAGDAVVLHDQGRDIHGTLMGVLPSGELLLRGHDGAEHRFAAGELVRGPRRVEAGPSTPLSTL
ncbi:MAG: biotin--[acetyl-CoA-carboxylase] ligase [Chloroflexota bacterium]|nr:biotin--[acetyl-CoA-carboxylase] ligase [Chloroflexota bacterium]